MVDSCSGGLTYNDTLALPRWVVILGMLFLLIVLVGSNLLLICVLGVLSEVKTLIGLRTVDRGFGLRSSLRVSHGLALPESAAETTVSSTGTSSLWAAEVCRAATCWVLLLRMVRSSRGQWGWLSGLHGRGILFGLLLHLRRLGLHMWLISLRLCGRCHQIIILLK